MDACQNCGVKIAEETDICPNCGAYTYGGEQAEDVEGRTENVAVEEEILDGPVSFNEPIENLPDETYLDDEVDDLELEAERRKFGKSTE